MKGKYIASIRVDDEIQRMEVFDTFETAIKIARLRARQLEWKRSASIAITLKGKQVWGAFAHGWGANLRETYNAVQGVDTGTIEHLALYLGGERVEKAPRGAHVVLGCGGNRGLYEHVGKFYIVGL